MEPKAELTVTPAITQEVEPEVRTVTLAGWSNRTREIDSRLTHAVLWALKDALS